MTTIPNSAGRCFLALAALIATGHSPAQEATSVAATPAEEIRYEVQSSRIIPDGGRNIIIQRVSPPVLPAPPVKVYPPPLTPEQLAARQAARAARPAPLESRLLCLNVTMYDDGLSYIEWWPQDGRGGDSFCAWSRADFRYLGMAADFDVVADNTRYSVFPFLLQDYVPRIGRPSGLQPVAVPEDGPGFVLVKGDASDTKSMNPITVLHQIYDKQGAELKAAWEERERAREEEKAWRATNPPPPPEDVVIRFWPVQSKSYSTTPVAPATSTSTPAAQ